ncbi:DUF4192 domain-containing protein [Thermoactinospora rubra]|uniref:DUF4192 domain-containing protein n=1 Tax=Thermoactinospora rubra TaxID=1088767 RepID=UPI001301D8D0|nr:DUF4192 domain-containing protein [Thermoactinospora rubra]
MPASPDSGALRVSSAADLIAIVPYLLGYHPAQSLVAIACDGHLVTCVTRFDLPERSDQTPELVGACAHMLHQQAASCAFLIGYGPDWRVTPVMDGIASAITASGIEIKDMIRCEDGRYWSYVCPDPECCSPDGQPYDVTSSAAAAGAVAAGLVAMPDRAAFCQRVAHVDGPEREPVRAATEAARAAAEAVLDRTDWFAEGLRRIRQCFERVRAGRPIPAEDIAWLGVLLTGVLVRDIALALTHEYGQDVSLRLWTEVTRRVEPEYAPAPAVNLAFLALRSGDGTLARAAAERALAVDPDYSFAKLIMLSLDTGLPPSQLCNVDFAELVEEIAHQAAANPRGARPVLPPVPDQN